jgi:hypothetical protein
MSDLRRAFEEQLSDDGDAVEIFMGAPARGLRAHHLAPITLSPSR